MCATAKRGRAADRATAANDAIIDDLIDALREAAGLADRLAADPHPSGCGCKLCRWGRCERAMADFRSAGGTARMLAEYLKAYTR